MPDQPTTHLTLPWPPSVNGYWRHVPTSTGKLTVVISRGGRQYRTDVGQAVLIARSKRQTPRAGHGTARLAVTITAAPPDARDRDLDNLLKATLDSLAYAGVFDNDSQIDDLRIRRAPPDEPAGQLQVQITAIEEPPTHA